MDPHKIGSSSVLTSIRECAITSHDQHAANAADDTHDMSNVDHHPVAFLLRAAMEATAINSEATVFSNHGAAGSAAWQTVKNKAREKGVELSLSRDGTVKAQNFSSTASRRKYPGDTQCYTLAETIEFVFAQGGSLAFALMMWNKQMKVSR